MVSSVCINLCARKLRILTAENVIVYVLHLNSSMVGRFHHEE